jgi:chitodextrinase
LGSILAVTAIVAILQVAGSADTSAAVAADPVLLLAGDIATCDSSADEATAALLDAYPSAKIQTLGDNVYDDGTASEFSRCYQPTWGRHKARTKPAAGNHDYNTPNASGYYGYFGAAAGDPAKGYYSYDLGAWHVVVLNSNCSAVGGCAVGSPQELWLRSDLAAHPAACTLAVAQDPRFASLLPHASMQALWQALNDYSVDVFLAGDQHNYERFAILGPTGAPDASGVRAFIVGTGGATPARFTATVATGSEVRNDTTFGVMKLTLHPNGYDWAFLPVAGQTFTDTGSEACEATTPDTAPPTQPTNLAATTPPGRVDLTWQAATDNVGVSGYDVLRNGALLATTGAVTTYSDTTVAPLTSYTYEVRARDAAGNVSPPSTALTVTTAEPAATHTFTPIADARVEEANPSTTYGTSSSLRTDAGPALETFVKFNVTGLSGAVQSARLRLYATNASVDGPSVRTTSNGWSETTLAWANRPAPTGALTDDRGAVPINAYTEWDVTPSVSGNGTVSFVLAQPGTDAVYFSSREVSTNRPELIVTMSATPPPNDTTPPAAPDGLTAVASTGRVDLQWQPATDDIAVTGYELFRNGTLLAAVGAVTSYADTAVTPNTTYSYEVRALDAAGNRSPPSLPASATTPAAPETQTLTFAPLADARVQEANPTTNYGTSSLRTDAGPAVETNLRFDVGTLPGAVQDAKLRLYVTQPTVDGAAVYPTGTGWTESGLTWATRPERTGPASDDRAALQTGVYAEWNVTSLVPPSGQVGFVLAQTHTDGTDFTPRESSTNRPQLVVTVAGGPPPPDSAPPSKPTGLLATAAVGRVDLTWQAATDNVAVTGYDVFRNGSLLAAVGAVTSFADTSVTPNTQYTYELRARDAANNVSPPSPMRRSKRPRRPPTSARQPSGLTRRRTSRATSGSTSPGSPRRSSRRDCGSMRATGVSTARPST